LGTEAAAAAAVRSIINFNYQPTNNNNISSSRSKHPSQRTMRRRDGKSCSARATRFRIFPAAIRPQVVSSLSSDIQPKGHRNSDGEICEHSAIARPSEKFAINIKIDLLVEENILCMKTAFEQMLQEMTYMHACVCVCVCVCGWHWQNSPKKRSVFALRSTFQSVLCFC